MYIIEGLPPSFVGFWGFLVKFDTKRRKSFLLLSKCVIKSRIRKWVKLTA